MKHSFWFLCLTGCGGLVVQSFLLNVWGLGWPMPHLLLLGTLALGGQGRTEMAQTLGLFWGLALDAQGLTLFGSQGWGLVLVATVAGKFSRQLDVSRWGAQTVSAGLASLGLGLFLLLVDGLFRHSGSSGMVGGWPWLGGIVMNTLLGPWMFRGMNLWADVWISWVGEGDHGAH